MNFYINCLANYRAADNVLIGIFENDLEKICRISQQKHM